MHRLVIFAAALAACTPTVDPTNPYDPATPPEMQAKAIVRGSLTTTVLASAEGLPVLLRSSGRVVAQVDTGPGGGFIFDRLVPGDYQVETAATGFLQQSLAVSLKAGDDLDLGALALVPLYGASAATLLGTVTLEGRLDGSGTLVEAVGKSYTALTDESGGFRLTVIPGDYTLRFSHTDFVSKSTALFTVGAGEELALQADQLPSNPATAAGHVDAELPGGGFGPLVNAVVTLEGSSITGLTNAAGDFTLTGIPSGSYLLRVVMSGYDGTSVPVLNLVGGELRTLADPLRVALSRGALAGVAALADSVDASGVLVELVGTGRALVTGSDGAFTFAELLVGTSYEVAARRDGYAPQSRTGISVAAGTTTLIPLPLTLARQGGTVSIAQAPYTRDRLVTLQLGASGVTHYRASEDPAFTGATWAPFVTGVGQPFTLADADGERVVYVQFAQDGSGSSPSAVVSTSIVLDRVAPAAPGLVLGDGSGWTPAVGGLVGLTLSAQDLPAIAGQVPSGLDRMELVNGADFSSGVQSYPFNLSAAWLLAAPSTDGLKTVSVRYVDRAGNVSAPVTQTITLDTLKPSAPSVAIVAPDPARPGQTPTPIVTLAVSATDANGGAGNANLFVRLASSSGFVGARYQPYEPSLSWLLAPGDGDKTVWAQFMDPAGNESDPVSATIHLDTSGPGAPALSITENDARPTNGQTRLAGVTLTLSSSGTPVEAIVAENPALTGGQVVDLRAVPLPTTTPFTLGGLGLRTVWVRYFDAAGNPSELATASVTLDQTAPTVAAPTLAPSPWAPTTAIAVTPPDAGQDELELSGAGIAGTPGYVPAPAGVPVGATLTAGDGVKAITVTYRDLAENTAVVPGLSVTLDGSPPAAAAFAIRGALADGTASASTTTTQSVTLDLSGQSDAGSGLAQMMLSESATFTGASWQPFAAAAPFSLSAGDGTRTVYAKLKDAVGNPSATVTGTIVLDTAGPTSPSVALLETDTRPANGYTNARAYRLTLDAAGTPVRALVAESPSFAGATAVSLVGQTLPYTTAAGLLSLVDADGAHTVWVRYFDAAGNASDPATASVVLDRTAPSNLPPALSATGFTGSTAVTLTPPNAGQDELQLSGAGVSSAAGFLSPAWGAAPAGVAIALNLTAGDGAKPIAVTYRDLADNSTAVSPSLSVTLDGAAPAAAGFAVTGTLADGTTSTSYTANTAVTLDLSAQGDGAGAGIQDVMLSNVSGFAGATWQPFTASAAVPWSLSPGDALKTVYAKFRDAVGNTTVAAVTGTITLAATPPSGGTLVVAGGAAATSSSSVALAVSATNATQLRVTVDGTAGGWITYPPSPPATASLVDPDQVNKVVQVTFRNAARVEGAGVSASIRYDHTAPTAGTLTLAGSLGNGATSSTLTTTAAIVAQLVPPTSDTAEMALAQTTTATACSTVFGSPTWQPVARSATVVLTGSDGAKRLCALFRDGAGNFAVANAVGADITLDTTPPTNPSFADLSTSTTNSNLATGTMVVASTDPAPNSGVTYQCYRSPASPSWTDCAPVGMTFTFVLTSNAPNVVGIRARDGAYNVSAGTTVQVIQDAVAPFPPNITAIRTTRDSLTLTWDPSADTDVDRFLVYYGNAAGDVAGTGAAQGPSPITVRAAGTGLHTMTLTGLVSGMPYYVAVEAVDQAGNASGKSGQRVAVPNKVNPRLLSSIGGQPRSIATLTDATSGKTFAYLAENQGVVQLDVTNEGLAPQVVGRAFVPNFVPDPIVDPNASVSRLPALRGGPPAVIACTRTTATGNTPGHCVVMAGSTLEGDYRADPDGYRAPAPVVFFPLSGTTAAPALGTVETTLPAQPHWVVAGVIDGQNIVFALEKSRIVAFSLDRIAFPRILAEEPLPGGIGTFLAADLFGVEMFAYAAPVVPGYARTYPPAVWYFDLTDAPYGAIYAWNMGTLLDQEGYELGDGYYGVATPYAAFDGNVYVAYKDPYDSGWLCSYDLWNDAWPAVCVELFNDPDVVIEGATAGNGHAYVFGSQGLGSMPYAYQVALSGTTVTNGAQLNDLTTSARFGHVGTYATIPATTNEHLFAIDRDSNVDFNVERWRVNGAAATYNANRYREIQPSWFAEQGRFLFAAQGPSINVIDLGNPFVPRVASTTTRANNTYGKLVTHGRWLYASTTNYVSGHGVEIFLISGNGTLTYQTRIATTQIPNDLAAMGRWLFVARSSATGIAAWDVNNPAAPVAAGSAATGSFVYALDARPATSGGTPYTAVLYAAQSAASPAAGALQDWGYAFNSVTPGSSTFTALGAAAPLPGEWTPHAVTARGPYAAVSTPQSTTVMYVGTPSAPSVQVPTLPVSGPLLMQGGYLVGLAPSGGAGGPLFDVFTGSATTSGPVDGSLLYSSCANDGAGSLAHAGGTYFASCERNGIATFSVGSADGGRLLKRFDVSESWTGDGAALAGDGLISFLGGAFYQTLDPTRLYYASELGNPSGATSSPGWVTNATLPGTRPYPRWLLQNDGITWGFNGEYLGTGEAIQAYETAYYGSAWPVRASVALTGTNDVTAQPATDGEWSWVPRSSSGGSWSSLEVYDLRNPAGLTATPAASDGFVVFGSQITALWWARDRLYLGTAGSGAIRVYNATGATLNTTGRTAVATIPSATTVTGITTSGRYLFVTYQKDDPALWGLTILRMDSTNRDGSGAVTVGSISSALPLANPVVSGDVLYFSNNVGVGALDLTPLWQYGTMPTGASGTVNVDPQRFGPVRFYVDGPFGYLMGGSYRAFDLR